MTKISGDSAREVVRAVTIVKVYRRPYPHHGNTSSCSRTLIVWKQSLEPRSTDLEALEMARSGRFELPTPRFVVWCSIQLSYERVAAGRKPALRKMAHNRRRHWRWQARTSGPVWRDIPLPGAVRLSGCITIFCCRAAPSGLPLCAQTLLSAQV